jgi:predicted MPP superfamily phosphohydrolase
VTFIIRHTVEIALLCSTIPIHLYAASKFWNHPKVSRKLVIFALVLAVLMMIFGLLLDSPRVHEQFPSWVYPVVRALHLAWMIVVLGAFCLHLIYVSLFSNWYSHSPKRRAFLNATYAAPAAVLGYGALIERDHFQIREVDIPIAGLPRELHGLRLLQLTDIHVGDYMSERTLARVIDMANETKPNLAIMTGDLLTKRGDPVDECLRQLKRVKADAGLIGCMGNHELYSGALRYVETNAARMGMDFLRQRAKPMTFHGKTLNFVGYDYQAKRFGPYLKQAELLADPNLINILLSHNPDVFRVSPEKGYQLTLSGHTHGGQIAVEYLNPYMNVASFVTPYIAGYYHERGSSLYVSRGVGTIGVPARVGVPPEITLIRLCAT